MLILFVICYSLWYVVTCHGILQGKISGLYIEINIFFQNGSCICVVISVDFEYGFLKKIQIAFIYCLKSFCAIVFWFKPKLWFWHHFFQNGSHLWVGIRIDFECIFLHWEISFKTRASVPFVFQAKPNFYQSRGKRTRFGPSLESSHIDV